MRYTLEKKNISWKILGYHSYSFQSKKISNFHKSHHLPKQCFVSLLCLSSATNCKFDACGIFGRQVFLLLSFTQQGEKLLCLNIHQTNHLQMHVTSSRIEHWFVPNGHVNLILVNPQGHPGHPGQCILSP